jgi:CubicO group peptidase (beta-lactamase class C family)
VLAFFVVPWLSLPHLSVPCLAVAPLPFVTRCRVPRSLESVTSVRPGAEVDPRDAGVDPAAIARIWSAVENLYRSGIHPAIALCVRHHGKVLIDRAIGHAAGNGPDDPPDFPTTPATPDTPFGLLSATKAVTAMIVHLLDQRNLLRLDDPVCEYIPEFGLRSKQWITLRHVLTHRAGLPNLPVGALDLDLLHRPEEILRILCEMPVVWRPGRQLAYHAVTGGFILGEVVRRVTGKTIRELHDEALRRPLRLRWMRYGVEPDDLDQIAINYFTGLPPLPPVSTVLRRALGVDFKAATAISNDPRFLCAIVPAGSMVASADDLSRFYQLLLNGGELDGVRIFDRRTVRRATAEQSYLEFDFTLGLPLRYGTGFMLGGTYLSFYGPDTRHAFGHLGFTNVVGWADRERQVAGALLTSGKPLFHPALYYLFDLMRQIGLACPKVPRRGVDVTAGEAA